MVEAMIVMFRCMVLIALWNIEKRYELYDDRPLFKLPSLAIFIDQVFTYLDIMNWEEEIVPKSNTLLALHS